MVPGLGELGRRFPTFGEQLRRGLGSPIEEVLDGAPEAELVALEERLQLRLPPSYREFLRCARGLWFLGGIVQMSTSHPFFHDFPPPADPSSPHQLHLRGRASPWPPPTNGMLCFAEFFMEADGDQVLFDVTRPGADGECPVMYYAHSTSPASVREIAPSFVVWLEQFLEYPEFASADDT